MRKEEYKLIAPDVGRLVHCYSHAIQNPEQPSVALMEVLDPLFKAMEDLAPFKKNGEAKGIWVMVPRGKISDWRTYEEAQEYEEVESKRSMRNSGGSIIRLKRNGISLASVKTNPMPGGNSEDFLLQAERNSA